VLPDGAVRHGTKRIEITDVRVVDHAGRRLEEVEAGRPLIVEIDFRSNERAEDAIFVVSAHAEGAGTPSLDLNTIDSGSYLGPLAESGTVALSLDRVDLVGGRYFIDVGVYRSDWSEPYDYIWKARRLEVSGDGPHASSIPPHRWSLR
jgi:lipopolysaccharide transport system ATP-binding protein